MTEEALADVPQKKLDFSRPVQIRNGIDVRILCTNGPGEYPVIGIVEGEMEPRRWTIGGKSYAHYGYSIPLFDLVQAPRILRRWINIWLNKSRHCLCTDGFTSKETADISVNTIKRQPERYKFIRQEEIVFVETEPGEGYERPPIDIHRESVCPKCSQPIHHGFMFDSGHLPNCPLCES